MDIETYRERRALALKKLEPRRRHACLKCFQPEFSCYCAHLQPFDPGLKFAILIHPIEAARRVATGRMSHLILKNSELIRGQTFTHNERVNALINDPGNRCLLLYPGQKSANLSTLPQPARVFESGKKPVLFVIDGTWGTSKKMVNQSENLAYLPRVQFTPATASRFRVRKQPRPNFYSTIEAIHQSLELLADNVGFNAASRRHDHLLEVFDILVTQQLQLMKHHPQWRFKRRI
ncbi:MAG: DTW domain-containing protein [Bdellovibrionales bacterium]|nr:DTW domain-containing protein [Bdellovibrionales bacterium]